MSNIIWNTADETTDDVVDMDELNRVTTIEEDTDIETTDDESDDDDIEEVDDTTSNDD